MPYTMDDLKHDLALQYRDCLTPEERVAGLRPEQVVAAMPPEYRVAGLTPEERLAGLTPEQLRTLLVKLQAQMTSPSEPTAG